RRFHVDREKKRGWPPSRLDTEEYFYSFLENVVATHEFRYRLGRSLVAIAYVEETPHSLNSIYAFYDPGESRRGLGTLDVLNEIQRAALLGKEHLYLGFYVKGCMSMAYKRTFQPCEMLIDGSWTAIDDRAQ